MSGVDLRSLITITAPISSSAFIPEAPSWTDILLYQSGGYRFKVFKASTVPDDVGTLNFADEDWQTGDGAFGGAEGGSPDKPQQNVQCGLGPTFKTFWQPDTEIVIRKHLDVQAVVAAGRVLAGVDNDIVAVYLNGEKLPNSSFTHEGHAELDEFQCDVPVAFIKAGTNLLVVHARDRGGETFLDVRFELLSLVSEPPQS